MAGSMGMTGEIKMARLRELALQKRMPLVWLLDSAGARIQEAAGSLFAGSGHLFREEVTMSGVVPLVAGMLGPCAAGTAYIPGLSDFVPMVVGQGAMALAGPHLTKAVTGEEISMEDLGGAKVHCRKSGVGDLECKDDAECIEAIKTYLSFFPSNCEQKPPVRETDDPDDRMSEKLLDIVPESNRQPVRHVRGDPARSSTTASIFDIKPRFAKTIITCLARFGGMPVGIVANQPKQLGGILENDSADKAARFVNLCDAFSIPLVFLQDVPGFMVGSKVEHAGIIRHGAKMLYAVSRATVPKITVVVRKAYGAGYYVMNGKAYEPDLIVAWPSAEISVMGAEGAVNIIGRSAIEASDDPEATREAMLNAVRKQIDVYIAAKNALIDDVIDPRETRPTDHPRPADGGGQAGRAAVAEARGDAGMSDRGESRRRSSSGRRHRRASTAECSSSFGRAATPRGGFTSATIERASRHRDGPIRPGSDARGSRSAASPSDLLQRSAADDARASQSSRRCSQRWTQPRSAGGGRMSRFEDPVIISCSISRRDRQPRPVPGDPLHAGGVRGRGAAGGRRGRVADPHPRAHARRRPELRDRGLPRDHRGDPGRGRRRDRQLLDRRDRGPDREADRLPARAAGPTSRR